MPFIEWKDSYRIGIEQIDEDHRHLVNLINELHAGISRHVSHVRLPGIIDELEALIDVLDALIDYATGHFALEEDCMREHEYPGYEEMKQAHGEFLRMAERLRRRFDEGRGISARQILDSLKEWLETHVLGLDQQFGEFMIRNEIQVERKHRSTK